MVVIHWLHYYHHVCWWQISLRNSILFVALLTVLGVGAHRLRDWGRESWSERNRLYTAHWSHYRKVIAEYESLSERNGKIQKLWDEGSGKGFWRRRWLPMNFYVLTTSKEELLQIGLDNDR